jgi:hypothetical protein
MNYTLCHPVSDIFVPYIGNYYLLLADVYLNFLSFITLLIHSGIYAAIVSPFFLYSKLVGTSSDTKKLKAK